MSSTKHIFAKLLVVSESYKKNENKGQVTLNTFRNFAYFSSYLWDSCMVARLCNIFKIINAITLIKTISEFQTPDKVLQGSWKENFLKDL